MDRSALNRIFLGEPVVPESLPGWARGQSAGRRSLWCSIRCALQGWREVWRTQRNLRVHVAAGIGVVAVGAWVGLILDRKSVV